MLLSRGSCAGLLEELKARCSVEQITFVSPNEAEIVAMAEALHPKNTKAGPPPRRVVLKKGSNGKCINDILDRELQRPIIEILQAGVKYVVLTLGSQGAALCSKGPLGQILYNHYPALPSSVVKLSGAGDCLVAGTLAALSRKLVEQEAVAYGVAAAKLAVESEMNVPQGLSWDALSGCYSPHQVLLLNMLAGRISSQTEVEERNCRLKASAEEAYVCREAEYLLNKLSLQFWTPSVWLFSWSKNVKTQSLMVRLIEVSYHV